MDKRMFLYRDEGAERGFKSDYLVSLNRANKWIIPIMKKFSIPITLDSVIEYSVVGDLRKAVVDYLTRRNLDGTDADLIRAIDTYNRNKAYYNEKIEELIKCFAEIETEKERAMILNKKDSDSDFFINGGEKVRKYLSKEHILSLLPEKKILHTNRIKEEYEDIAVTSEQNFNLYISQSKLAQIRGLLILNGETLEFDTAKIQEKCTVYADGNNEIRLMEKLQQLANLINEIYGKDFYNPNYAFDTFLEKTEGGVKINSKIEKNKITQYSKNV